jgi:hypothetical protein
MKSINRFITDFVGMFLIIIGSAAIALVETTTLIIYSLQRFCSNILIPFMIEMMADVNYVTVVIYQGLMSAASDVALTLSKWLLKASQIAHNKSEELIHKSWID